MTDSGFDAFCVQFLDLMKSVASCHNLKDQVKKRLEKNWTENEIVYFYVLVALYSLSETRGKRLKVLIQELSDYMSEVVGAAMIKEVVEFSDNVSSDLPIAIGNIKNSKSTSASDIIKIWRLYTEANPPNVGFLRDFDLIDILISDTFGPNQPSNHINQRLEILAIASARDEEVNQEKDTLKELKNLHLLLGKVNSMNQIQDNFHSFLSATRLAITSAALVYWISYKLQDPNFYEWTAYFVMGETPWAFYLLDEIAIQQPRLRIRLIELWSQILTREFSISEVKPEAVQICREKILDHFLLLAKLDSAGNILNHFKENVDSIDDSLILHFLKSLLDIIDQPFPQDFSMKIVHLVSKLQLEAIDASDSKPKLLEFFEKVSKSVQLSAENQSLLYSTSNSLTLSSLG